MVVVCNLLLFQMDPIEFLSVLVAVFSAVLASFSVTLMLRYIRRQKEQTDRLIKGQREMLENRIYDASEPFVKDAVFFDDTSKILIDSSDQEMIGATQVPDFSYFKNMDINLSSIEVEMRSVAVLMPFNNKFDKTYAVIKEACVSVGYSCHRSDEELLKSNTLLRKYIVEMILKASVIIAVLDGRNANVYYEIGIAHAMGKLVLLVANVNKTSDVPVDFKANRLILYNNPKELKERIQNTLKAVHHD